MTDKYPNPSGFYNNIEEAAAHIIDVVSGLLQVNTIFIATNDGQTNTILKAFNRREQLVNEGDELPFDISYCSLVGRRAGEPLVISDTASSPLTAELEVTRALGSRSFIGLPIILKNGQFYGTICILDHPSYPVSETDLKTLSAMAVFLAHVVELEHAVAELREAQQVLRESHAASEQSSKIKSKLLAMIGQEIKTPMTGIMGMTDLMQDTELSEEQKSYMNIIETSNNSLLNLVTDILDYSKMESGGVAVEAEPFELLPALEEVVNLYEIRNTGRRKVRLDAAPGLPSVVVGDPVKIRDVLVKLLDHASKNARSGELTLTAVNLPDTEHPDAHHIRFAVKAPLITPDKLEFLLETAGGKAGGSSVPIYETSLDLAISKKLVDLMEGQIWTESDRQKETDLIFSLTLSRYAEAAEAAELKEFK
ncbi:GAF domain-containing sensor histidine kinase [Paenibacillus chitinolyticus]|uniref:sensor histidine kinase n=1 Tax=Paenibacillus chitinolyticus TaxID=79263 RepID=UPI002DBE5B5D|nr:GAF domain-containing sensor histidine kinase [Paenibacillus chitinolyticus]MEC0244411.1 GAF domain-containing sensor histidine kinase [Paenibacillus chitinolyticus]